MDKKYKFEHMEIKDFNKRFNTNIKEEQEDWGEFYDTLLSTLDNRDDVGYFSASGNAHDVIDDIENESPSLNLVLVEVDDVYLAIY